MFAEIAVTVFEKADHELVSPFIFDEKGEVLRDRTDEEMAQEKSDCEGKTVFLLKAECNGRVKTLNSPLCGPNDRQAALAVAFHLIGHGVFEAATAPASEQPSFLILPPTL